MTDASVAPAGARPPDAGGSGIAIQRAPAGDRIYRAVITFFAICVPLLLVLIAIELTVASWPALTTFGTSLFTTTEWDPVRSTYGIAPAIYGTIVTSLIALVIATPLAVGVAIFLSEFAPPFIRQPLAFLVDLLAAIPSVIFGLWGFLVLIPFLRDVVVPFLTQTLGMGSLPLFAGVNRGNSLLAAGVILAIMVLPYISAVSREILLAVPRSQREAALALGATRWEMIWGAVLPYARRGIMGGVILGLARALGETMAVTLVIGNVPTISASLLSQGYTLASLIANKFAEAGSGLESSALMAAGLTLLGVTLVVNAIARWLVWQVSKQGGGVT
jgi:phosphate transport system permease protein